MATAGPKTISEKILARAAKAPSVSAGEYVKAEADTIVMCDLAWLLAGPPINQLGARILDPDRVIVAFDHKVPADNSASAEMHRLWREFCAEQGIEKLHDVGDHGISHVLSIERGYARPGTLQVNIDSHANTCGAVGCFAIALGMDIISDMVLGWNWYVVPESVRVHLSGTLARGVMVRDVAQHVVTDLGDEVGNGRALEFVGPLVDQMRLADRMTLCNWSRKIQAVAGLINPDESTLAYVRGRTDQPLRPLLSDEGASYAEERHYDVDSIEPLVAAPPDPTNTKLLAEVSGTTIHQAFVGSCAGGSLDDLRTVAGVLAGRRVHPGVRMIASPGSQEIWRRAQEEGILTTLSEAGCVVTASTCGACIGGMGALGDGEVCVSTSTENFLGRMGTPGSLVYLASPLTVAASAVSGSLADSRTLS
jgi:3-isopropylmalate/(R)-2-methylmalate dehydratase large subunit